MRGAGRGKGKWVQSVGTTRGRRVAGEGERDEPSFINLDRLLNPGFDETLGWKRTYTYVTARRLRVHART